MLDDPENTKTDTAMAPDQDSLPATTESNKKRAFLGLIVGGVLIVGLIVAIITLISEAGVVYKPTPVKPTPHANTTNPYVLSSYHMDSRAKGRAILFNNRSMIEGVTTAVDKEGAAPVRIRNTTENFEPIELIVTFDQLDEHLLNVKYRDTNANRWEVPPSASDKDPYWETSERIRATLGLTVSPQQSGFWWNFTGKGAASSVPLMSTKGCNLQYFDKYIEFEARVQTSYIYGMGERTGSFELKTGKYSLWNYGRRYESPDYSELGIHGSHPFFLNKLESSNDFIGVFMRNSNAMQFSFWNNINGTFVNYKMIGGIIDLYVIHAAGAEYIIRKYHSLIGRPYLPPVWALGFQQGRRGYKLADMKEVVEKYRQAKIPVDALWADVDLNENGKAFTVNNVTYAGVKEFVKYLHSPHEGVDMRFVAVVPSSLKAQAGYTYYDEALKKDCLILSAHHAGQPFEGRTLAGPAVWLDFFLHDAVLVWAQGLSEYFDLTSFDGIWITENEPYSECYGECVEPVSLADPKKAGRPDPFHNESEFNYLQYRPTTEQLEADTLPMAAYHHSTDYFAKQFYTHNLFGLQITEATHQALASHFEEKRFLLAARSTWPGSGHYGSHWFDQNHATWQSLANTIPLMLSFNMFGIPHVGAPIGGFIGSVDKELLIRWYELGAMSPLMLSYTDENTNRKEAYNLTDSIPLIRKVFLERYALIRFMYTKMFESHVWGGPVIHPVFFDFPEDSECFKREIVDSTFMWSHTLYVAPALIPGMAHIKVYLPNWRWYDIRTSQLVADYKERETGNYYYLNQPLGQITMLIKGGSIIPYQSLDENSKIGNVEDLKGVSAIIIIAPDHTGKAIGSMVSDADGIMPRPDPKSNTYRHYGFTYMNQIFRINKIAGFDFHGLQEYDTFFQLRILDVFGKQDISFACYMDMNFHKKELAYNVDIGGNVLTIQEDGMYRVSMSTFESIVWGTKTQHDFCKHQMQLTNLVYGDEGRIMEGTIETNDAGASQLKYSLKAALLTNRIISMQIIQNEAGKTPWIVPEVVDETVRQTIKATMPFHEVGFRTSDLYQPFSIELATQDDSRDFIFTSKHFPFVYVKNFMQIKFMINSRHLFGLGERIHEFELTDGTYSLFNYDATSEESGLPPGNNMWGSHAFYLIHLHNPLLFAGVFFLTSNPLDVQIRHVGMQTQVNHLFVGGIIDAFFFNAGSAEEVLTDYHYIIGKPAPMPYWAFGYHQCRWGYKGTEQLQLVEQGFDNANIPLDALWIDKDYMNDERDFTIDRMHWALLSRYVDLIHTKGLKFVMLVDPALAIDDRYESYKRGMDLNVYVKSSFTGKPLVGVSWPGYSAYIDFINPTGPGFWENELLRFHMTIDYDGLWLDMNEPSSFCDGECSDGISYTYYNFPLDFYDDLYYNPTHRALEKSTISMEALHYGGEHQPEFNYHNLYGLTQSRATHAVFTNKLSRRPFILSSSTFPSSGRYVGHWLGDNYSAWPWMGLSLASIFNFQMFGIPFAGADVCGFNGNASVSLCSRWLQLGAFYPMMRNHNSRYSDPQEPYIDGRLTRIAQKAIRTRYSLGRYLYTLHMLTVLNGGVYFKPMLFEFPSDPMMYKILDSTLMLGYAIRMTPVLADGVGTLVSYFPNCDWYELATFKHVMHVNHSATTGKNLTLISSLDVGQINAHIKGGSIFVYQNGEYLDGTRQITAMQKYPVSIVAALYDGYSATGHVYYDDDETMGMRDGQYHKYDLYLSGETLHIMLDGGSASWHYNKEDFEVSHVDILGAKEYEHTACAKGFNSSTNSQVDFDYTYNRENEVLTLKPRSGMMTFGNIANVTWSNTTCY